MKKSSFVAMILGTVSGVLFALGMCMALITEWNAFIPGVVFGGVGILLGLITVLIWRKMEHKKPIKINSKTFITILVGVAGALTLGVGMCLCMVLSKMVLGILVGILGIVILLCLIPIVMGIKE
ncbi:MAG: hypothetical protein ACI4HL_07645 [Ruminococcus sp.]